MALRLLGAALLVFELASCSGGLASSYTSTYRLPWPDASGTYQLQDIQVSSFTHPESLEGRYARVLAHPYDSKGQLADPQAAGRFFRAGHVEIAGDVLSLQAATVYAHMERLYQLDTLSGAAEALTWPQEVGIDVDVSNGTVNNALYDGNRNAVIVVPYTDPQLPITLNAGILAHEHFHSIFQELVIRYLPDPGNLTPHTTAALQPGRPDVSIGNPMLTVPRPTPVASESAGSISKAQGVATSGATPPLAIPVLNATASAPSTPVPPPPFFLVGADGQAAPKVFADVPFTAYNQFLVRGLNEGLADFYGWVYSGNPTFIADSLPPAAVSFRRMDVSPGRMPTRADWRSQLLKPGEASVVRPPEEIEFQSYLFGTFYSTFLRELTIRLNQAQAQSLSGTGDSGDLDVRADVAHAVIASLPEVMPILRDQYKTNYIDPVVLLMPLYAHLSHVTSDACDLFTSFTYLTSQEAAAAPQDSTSLARIWAARPSDGGSGDGTVHAADGGAGDPTASPTPAPSATPAAPLPPACAQFGAK